MSAAVPTNPDDLYLPGVCKVPDAVLIRFAEVVLDLGAAEEVAPDARPREVLALLRQGQRLAAARLGAELRREAHRVAKAKRTAWHHALVMVAETAAELHERGASLPRHRYGPLASAASVLWRLDACGAGKGSGRQAHDRAREMLARLCDDCQRLERSSR